MLDVVNKALDSLKPFDLKINGKSFLLDYQCVLYQDREKPLELKATLFNTYLASIDNCSLVVAGFEIFKSLPNNDTRNIKDSENDGITELTLNITDITRELNFSAKGIIPVLELSNNNQNISNSNIVELTNQYKGKPSGFNNLSSLQKIQRLKSTNGFLTYYIQSKQVVFITDNTESKAQQELKVDSSKFKIFFAEQNLSNEILTLKGIPQFLLEVGTQIKYNKITYILDSFEINVSSSVGVQAQYICKTLDLIKREVNNGNNASGS